MIANDPSDRASNPGPGPGRRWCGRSSRSNRGAPGVSVHWLQYTLTHGWLMPISIKLMCRAADEAGFDPDRLSFIRTLRVIRRQVTDQADFPPEQRNAALKATITEILEKLNKGRHRTYPRVVKRVP